MQANEDIQSSIPLLSETGPIAIPLSCLIKRAVISVQPQVSTHHVLCGGCHVQVCKLLPSLLDALSM